MNDLISKLSEMRSNYNCFDETEEPYYRALSEAIQLASAQPERTGKWIACPELGWGEQYKCSECGEKTVATIMGKPRFKFCPMCGAEMRGEQE